MNTIPRKLGRYVIIREIGRGAMGVVYKAHDPIIEREVAIKAIQLSYQVSPEEKDVYWNRFYREAKAAGKLNHPNIVTIFDVDEDKETGTPFIVMEFLEGTTVADVISSGVLLPLEDVNHMIVQLADALNYAHNEGIIHRDVKSSNILVLPGMKVKIMDFGIARLPSSDLTSSGQFVGTPNYMSPEQLEGKTQVDGRSDLFSLGVVFYMLLTCERPFAGDSFNTVAYKIAHVDPPPLRRVNPNVPEAYNSVLNRCLAKDPAERYQSGADLVDALKALELSTPELPEPVEIPEQDIPTPLPPARTERITPEEMTISHKPAPPVAVPPSVASRWVIPFIGAFLVTGSLATAGYFYFQSVREKERLTETVSPVPSGSLEELSRQNTIRIKQELALGYQENGQYDQSIQEFEGILRLDPDNEEAAKYLALVKDKKAQEDARKLEELKQQKLAAHNTHSRDAKAASATTKQPATTIDQEASAIVPIPKTRLVSFEFEHSLPSGSLSIYLGNQLIYEGVILGEKKGALMFKRYKGRLSGNIELPSGDANLRIQVICRERGISTIKPAKVFVSPASTNSLRIKYLENTKQLEVKWT